mmetsp:Transcript_977/g.1852  ORF Transcript_977/g.1852 Transcript_977/m.1852 type:complete len:463 (+) Transcript_977:105-1493(+)
MQAATGAGAAHHGGKIRKLLALRHKKPAKRRRPGPGLALCVLGFGIVVIAHTFLGGTSSVAPPTRGGDADGFGDALAEILEASTNTLEPANTPGASDAKQTGRVNSARKRTPAAKNTGKSGQMLFNYSDYVLPPAPIPVVRSVNYGDQIIRDLGGASITVGGRNFGDEDCDVRVKVGDTWSPRTDWVSSEMLVARTPMGIGKDLDITVWVSPPAKIPSAGIGRKIFSYTRPFIYDMTPFRIGTPIEGPFNITLMAWGVGYWDTKPEAQINGQPCYKTFWTTNQSVVCEIASHTRISLQNPEIKAGGQRSICGILAPGVCTVSAHHGSVSSPARIRQEIREIKSRGGDWKTAARLLSGGIVGGMGQENTADNPCTNIGTCRLTTFVKSLSSAILMMMGMGSLCLCMLVAKPISQWLVRDWGRARDLSRLGEYDDLLDAEEGVADVESDDEDKSAEYAFKVSIF